MIDGMLLKNAHSAAVALQGVSSDWLFITIHEIQSSLYNIHPSSAPRQSHQYIDHTMANVNKDIPVGTGPFRRTLFHLPRQNISRMGNHFYMVAGVKSETYRNVFLGDAK